MQTVNPKPSPKTLHRLAFSKRHNLLIVYRCILQVLVYQLKGMPARPEDQEETLNKIIASSLASQLQEEEGKPKDDQQEQQEVETIST